MTVLSRQLILWPLFFLPRDRKIAIERRLRGKSEYRKLQLADWVLISWGKSGRTWFRVMLSHFYQTRFGLPEHELLGFDNLYRKNPSIPRVLFTHNNYMRDYLRDWDTLNHFRGKKLVLLARDPRDVAVSQFFQWKYRMRPIKKLLNEYPAHGEDISILDFVMDAKAGIPRIVDYFNGWAVGLRELEDILLIRYEDMRADPTKVMRQVLEFLGTPGTDDEIRHAVDFAAYENMKKMEQKNFFRSSGIRVKPGDPSNPQSFKVRRAKVRGYRDYFEDDQIHAIDAMIDDRLDPVFGYGLKDSVMDSHDGMKGTA
jgi:hypothetical protein